MSERLASISSGNLTPITNNEVALELLKLARLNLKSARRCFDCSRGDAAMRRAIEKEFEYADLVLLGLSASVDDIG